jgi:hypothetical protein
MPDERFSKLTYLNGKTIHAITGDEFGATIVEFTDGSTFRFWLQSTTVQFTPASLA